MATVGRRTFLKGALLAGAAGAGLAPATQAQAAEPTIPRIERPTFVVTGLDPAHDGLRIAQLSDLHVGARTSPDTIRAAVQEANDFDPDLVVLTGDYVSFRKTEIGLMREQLSGLAAPTVAILGNHDVWVDPAGASDSLRSLGYEVLENAWTRITLRGAPLTIVGIGDHLTHRDDAERALKGVSGTAPLVLAHGPRTADKLRHAGRPLLCLSGHTHGGQINIPILTPVLLAGFAREPYLHGRYHVGPVQLYVNRGIGNSGFRVRINSPPEVTLAVLRSAELQHV